MVRVSDECHERLKKFQAQRAAQGFGVLSYGKLVAEGIRVLENEERQRQIDEDMKARLEEGEEECDEASDKDPGLIAFSPQ